MGVYERVVLVAGAGGPIGSELCRQILKFSPRKLLLLDVSENDMYDIELEIRSFDSSLELIPLVKDVRDKQAIELVFAKYKSDVVFHAAAHKHVPLMEANPEEAIKSNVQGTYNVAQAADRWGVKKFVFISTDKAVTAEEGTTATTHQRIYVARPNGLNGELIEGLINNINLDRLPKNEQQTEDLLRSFIPAFRVDKKNQENIMVEYQKEAERYEIF